jgi:predicted RNA-binding protein with PIN domain
MRIIVDGNNLLGALGLLSGPDAEVEEFLQKLEMAAVQLDWEVDVIFDGSERYLPRESGPLVVKYAQGKSADSRIERMVFQSKDRKKVAVVTRDHAVSDCVRGMGAWVWSPERLKEEMSRGQSGL